MPWPEIGKWNHLESSIGARGMGKSTWQSFRALKLQKASGGYVIGHSLGARLNRKLPAELGGDELPIVYHTSIQKLERGLRRSPEKWHILAPPMQGDGNSDEELLKQSSADALLKFAMQLSTAIRKREWKKKNPLRLWNPNVSYEGIEAPPIIILIDEGIALESASPSRKEDNRWFLQFLYSLRHLHIALLYAIQDGSARSWRILEQSTMIYVFAIRHQWALECMRAAGASQDEIDRIKRLGKYQHVTLQSLEVGGTLNVDALKSKSGGRVPGEDETASTVTVGPSQS